MRRWTMVLLCGLMVCALGAWSAAAEEGMEESFAEAMPMDAAMMEGMERMTPGDEHEILGRLVGDWTYDVKIWMGGPEPVETSGEMHGEWVMDGRFVQTTWTGDFMGAPFVGQGLDGYNRAAGQYESQWIDNQSTGMMLATGHADGNELVMEGESWDMMSGAKVRTKSVSTFEDGTWSTVSYTVGDDGSETKQMEITAQKK